MDVFDAITTRVSVTEYQSRGVEREKLARVLEAARWAPSAGNMQSWEFITVEDDELQERLSQYARNQPHIREAPVAIVILADMERAERKYGDRGRELYAIQETAAAMQNMLLEAYNQDLGAAWIGAFPEDQVCDLLSVPDRLRPVAIVTVGYPRNWPEQPNRFDVTDITYINHYGELITPLYDKITWKGLRDYSKQASKKFSRLKDKYT